MAGKASLPKTPIDDTVDLNKARKKQFGRERAAYAKVQTGSGSTGVSFAGTGNTIAPISSNMLTTEGGIPMSGPLAFTPKLVSVDSNDEIDIGKSTSNFSSYIIVAGASNSADDLKQIHGANNAGQILYLEAATTTPITLKQHTGSSGGGNINIPGGSDFTVSGESIVLLQWDTTYEAYSGSYGQWTLVSSSGSSSLLSSNNTWTGTNTFSGAFSTAGSTTSLTSANIYLGDQSTDAITITGAITSTGTNVWSGINTFSGNVSITGSTITLGDSATDVINMYGKVNSDLNMGTFDIKTLDRLLFDVNGSDTIGTSDYGIGAEALGGTTLGLVYSTPASKTHKFNIGGTPELTISDSYISAATKRITNVTDPSGAQDAATKAYVDANSGGSGADISLSNLNSTGEAHFDSRYGKLSSTNTWSSGQTFSNTTLHTGTASFNGNTILGNSSSDVNFIYGDLDFKTNTSSSTVNFYSLYSEGYITIKINGSSKRLYYFAG